MASMLISFSCNNKLPEAEIANIEQIVTETVDNSTKQAPKGRYAIKSGIVEYKTEVMGMLAKQTLIFDDYGQKEIQDVEMTTMGIKIHTVTIYKDGYVYTLDMEKKTATKQKGVSPNIDFENLSEEMVKDMNLKKEGTEDVAGKTCDKMSLDYKKYNMTGFFSLYKGVPLKVDANMGTMKMKLIAEKFLENEPIAIEKFEIPSDFKIKEL